MLYTINAVINPDQKDYIQYYLEDRNFLIFTKEMGLEMNLFYQDVTINSDVSIIPFEDIETDKINLLGFFPTLYPYKHTPEKPFARFYMVKDQASVTYTRAVQKVSAVLSFIGGIIGAVLGLLIILNAYTSFSFELAVAYQVFKKY